jgi:uncharacterized repeat protein (TIGR01451 family)
MGEVVAAAFTRPRVLLVACVAAILFSATVCAPAHAAVTNLFAADPTTDTAEDSFTDDMGIEAIGTATVRGADICIVGAAVTDPGDNSLTCGSRAFGEIHPVIGLGTFFLPIAPPVLKTGTFRLLADGGADGEEPDTLSEPFTVSSCSSCDPAPANAVFQEWKDSAQRVTDGAELACALFNTEETSKADLGKAILHEALNPQPSYVVLASAAGGFVFTQLLDEAPEIAQLDKWLAVMHAVMCRAAKMYAAIVADPPDPNYSIVEQPTFSGLRLAPDADTSVLQLTLDAIRAHGAAELAAVQRFEGAQADSAMTWEIAQAQAAAADGLAMSSEMRTAARELASFADRLDAAGATRRLTQGEYDAAKAFSDRVADQGFSQAEADELAAAGFDGLDIAELQDIFGHPILVPSAVGKSLAEGLRVLTNALAAEADVQERFAQGFVAFTSRQSSPSLTAVIRTPTSTPQLVPFAARFSGEPSRPGTSPITQYHWDFGDGVTDDGIETSHLFTASGPHDVTLTIHDADGQTDVATMQVSGVDRSQLLLPVCNPGFVQFQCDGFDPLPPGGALTVAGSGPRQVTVTHTDSLGAWANALIWFPVDDEQGTIDGTIPGQPGWIQAALGRARVAFDQEKVVPKQITLDMNGGDHLAFALTTNSDFDSVLHLNPLNLADVGPILDFPFAAANPYQSVQVLPYVRGADGMVQLGFEDIPGDSSDFADDVYEVIGVEPHSTTELEVNATADRPEVGPGDGDGYEVKIRNVGPGTVILDSISDTLPAGFAYVPGSTRGATTTDPDVSGRTLTWSGRFHAPQGGVAGLHFAVNAAQDPGYYLDDATADARGFPITPSGPSAGVRVVARPQPTPATAVSPPAVKPSTPNALTASQVIKLPSAKACVSRRRFRIRLVQPKGVTLVSATVLVNGKKVKVVAGARLKAPVDLRGLPKGRFIVKITAVTADGRKVSDTRRYRTCVPRRRR